LIPSVTNAFATASGGGGGNGRPARRRNDCSLLDAAGIDGG
jgi:hypothetical protein